MHELAVTQSMLAIALEQAEAVPAEKVTRINIVLGELSGIVDDCVQFYFDFISKDSIAAEAALSFRRIPTQVRCRDCALVFTPNHLPWACPDCHKQGIEIIGGRECYIESIEVE